MNAKRILKEARPLFWPWCAVTLACVIPLVRPLHSIGEVGAVGFFVGIPLLASLAFGNEFQHRTLSLLLAQPVGRMEIWGEKMSITVVAVVSVVLVFSFSWRALPLQISPKGFFLIGAWITATVASATFWVLVARSTLGGVALNIAAQFFIWIMALGLAGRLHGIGYIPRAYLTVVPTATSLGYAGVMLWLGRRMLARFQGTGGMDDLLTAGPDVMPGALVGWLRCRPSGAVLNLIRKELRLLRPVWLITLVAALGWAGLTLFGLLHPRGLTRNFETAVISVGVISTLIIAILAGSLSLGEERTSGTHSWHLTLPVSARRQWLIKLFVALFAGFVGAGLLPLLIAGRVLGSSGVFVDGYFGTRWLLWALILTFGAFWCACAVKGTVRAVLWVLPVLIAVGLASVFGERAGRELVDVFVARFDLFASFRFTTTVSRLGPNVFSRLIEAASNDMTGSIQAALVLTTTILIPTLLFAVIQSYRLFRAQLQDRALSVVRSLLPLAMTAFLCSFLLLAFYTFVQDAAIQTRMLIFGTHNAIHKILPSAAKLDATHPLQLTGDDVEKAFKDYPFSLPANTRRWLRNARITVTPDKSYPSGFSCAKTQWESICYYSATIHLADGTDLTQSYGPADRKFPFGHLTMSAHWPGAAGQELLRDPWDW